MIVRKCRKCGGHITMPTLFLIECPRCRKIYEPDKFDKLELIFED